VSSAQLIANVEDNEFLARRPGNIISLNIDEEIVLEYIFSLHPREHENFYVFGLCDNSASVYTTVSSISLFYTVQK
jgi:hypothetical protein